MGNCKKIAILVLTIAMGIASGLLLCRLSFNPKGKAILLNYVLSRQSTKYRTIKETPP